MTMSALKKLEKLYEIDSVQFLNIGQKAEVFLGGLLDLDYDFSLITFYEDLKMHDYY